VNDARSLDVQRQSWHRAYLARVRDAPAGAARPDEGETSMCGVFGFVGQRLDVGSTVGTALRRLEYRGYDSWGMAWQEAERMRTAKDIGRLNGTAPQHIHSQIGIGHTRWATHGKVTTANAHPHLDCTGRIAIVHNGIIENIEELRSSLAETHEIRSETDSEVVGHLLEETMRTSGLSLEEALRRVFPHLEGFNAIVAVDAQSDVMVAAKRTSPLLLGYGDEAIYIASDVLAFAGLASGASAIEDGMLVRIDHQGVRFSDLQSGEERALGVGRIACSELIDDAVVEPGAFMRREIDEQPAIIDRISRDLAPVSALASLIRRLSQVVVVGCGSALNAAEYGRYLLADTGINAMVIPASEAHHFLPLITPTTLLLAVSQSGETADVIEAVHLAQAKGAVTGALVNVAHSTLARTVDQVVPLLAGPEQSVLATKSFTAMLARFIQIASALNEDATVAIGDLQAAVAAIDGLLSSECAGGIHHVSQEIVAHEHVFVLGRGQTWPIARETALKLQEGAYVHAQAFAGGELKHGPLALITEGTPCLVLPGEGQSARDLDSNAQEVRSRGGSMIGIGAAKTAVFDRWLPTGLAGPAGGLVETVIAQRLAWHAAIALGINPDRPRNLAKSVTVN
jgi:glucosamine--fructose-6-phosphate aminotransferase (isomerizing)